MEFQFILLKSIFHFEQFSFSKTARPVVLIRWKPLFLQSFSLFSETFTFKLAIDYQISMVLFQEPK